MIALLASAVGKLIVKSPAVDVLSAPKSKTQTLGSPVAASLYIKAPLAVIDAEENVRSLKSVKAVVLDVVGFTLVKNDPFAVYPVPLTSLEEVYAVVDASKDALLVYSASLNTLLAAEKSCVAVSNSFLNEVHIAWVIAIIGSSIFQPCLYGLDLKVNYTKSFCRF